jgi:hypothetical protein
MFCQLVEEVPYLPTSLALLNRLCLASWGPKLDRIPELYPDNLDLPPIEGVGEDVAPIDPAGVLNGFGLSSSTFSSAILFNSISKVGA